MMRLNSYRTMRRQGERMALHEAARMFSPAKKTIAILMLNFPVSKSVKNLSVV